MGLGVVWVLSGCSQTSQEAPGDIFKFPIPAPVVTLDPARVQDAHSARLVRLSFESLFKFSKQKLVPLLAKGDAQASADDRTYTVRLRKGVLFQDDEAFRETQGHGRELVASDIAFTFKRLADPRLKSSLWPKLQGLIEGLDDWRADAVRRKTPDYSQKVSGLQVMDRYTFRFKLTRTHRLFPRLLGVVQSSIVAPESLEAYGIDSGSKTLGSGPYRLDAHTRPPEQWGWTLNSTWTPPESSLQGSSSRFRRILAVVKNDGVDVVRGLEKGEFDWSWIPHELKDAFFDENRTLRENWKKRSVRMGTWKDMSLGVLRFHHPSLELRKAFFHGLLADGISLGRPIPRSLRGGVKKGQGLPQAVLSKRTPSQHLKRARRYLGKAGFPGGRHLPPFELVYGSQQGLEKWVRRMVVALEKVGIRLRVREVSRWQDFEAQMNSTSSPTHRLFFYYWAPETPHVHSVLSSFRSPLLPSLYEKPFLKAASLGPVARARLHIRLEKELLKHLPFVWIQFPPSYWVSQPWVKGAHDLARGVSALGALEVHSQK